MANVTVRMTSDLFHAARHYNVLIPPRGETVELPGEGVEALIRGGHAELATDSEDKRGPGRPRKTEA